MSASTRGAEEKRPQRIVVFGATGHLGRELIGQIAAARWPITELVGVASAESADLEFDYQGEALDALTEWPRLRVGDLVFVCTPPGIALEIVRAALRAEVPCIDCSGVMAQQSEVAMPVRARELAGTADPQAPAPLGSAPLLAMPSATVLAWAPLLEALEKGPGLSRILATVLCSASALGRRGPISLSEESIALFNQSEEPTLGPAGQTMAFDVIPQGPDEQRIGAEIGRVFGSTLRVDVATVQVPTFVGEGAALAIELAAPIGETAFMKLLESVPGLQFVEEGIGTRGLEAVDAGIREPSGPTLRDAAGAEEVLAGRVRPDRSLPAGLGWRLWLSYDPLWLAAQHAVRLAAPRFQDS